MPSDPHLFLCNGATLARAATQWKNVAPEELRDRSKRQCPNCDTGIGAEDVHQRAAGTR